MGWESKADIEVDASSKPFQREYVEYSQTPPDYEDYFARILTKTWSVTVHSLIWWLLTSQLVLTHRVIVIFFL